MEQREKNMMVLGLAALFHHARRCREPLDYGEGGGDSMKADVRRSFQEAETFFEVAEEKSLLT